MVEKPVLEGRNNLGQLSVRLPKYITSLLATTVHCAKLFDTG